MKILYLEDHDFFANQVKRAINLLIPESSVTHCRTYDEASKQASISNYDISIVDFILTNGKTGIQFVENHKSNLGRIIFLTGCIDDPTINAISHYSSISKLESFKTRFKDFLNGTVVKIHE